MMDEIWFRLSNQLETLQIRASVISQQGHQWLITWLTRGWQLFRDFYDERCALQVEEIRAQIFHWLRRAWEDIRFRYDVLSFSGREFYQQFGNMCIAEVTRKEVAFCLVGLTFGTVIGYNIGVNWQKMPRHLHRMKSIVCHCYIGTEGVSLIEDAEMPVIQKSNELLIQVKAASVNIVDAKICSGYCRVYRGLLNSGRHKTLPVTLGRDCAGVVVDIGQSVIDFDIGDEVFLAVPSWSSGTMVEYLVVPEIQVAKKPKLVTFEASASLPYNGCLAWDALVKQSNIQEGNARGKRVLVYGGATPVGCILTQLIKLWGGYVASACKPNAVAVSRALGADDVITLDDSDVEKELLLFDKFDAIFYTGGPAIDEGVLRRRLHPRGAYVSTIPEDLTSDSLGFVLGSIFAAYVRMKLLAQVALGFNTHQWKEGAKIKTAYLQAIRELVDADQLQIVIDRAFAPHNIEQAMSHVLDPLAIGSTIVKFH